MSVHSCVSSYKWLGVHSLYFSVLLCTLCACVERRCTRTGDVLVQEMYEYKGDVLVQYLFATVLYEVTKIEYRREETLKMIMTGY